MNFFVLIIRSMIYICIFLIKLYVYKVCKLQNKCIDKQYICESIKEILKYFICNFIVNIYCILNIFKYFSILIYVSEIVEKIKNIVIL